MAESSPIAPITEAAPQAVQRWALTLKTPMDEQAVTLSITERDGGLSGTMGGEDGEAPITEGRVAGARLSWKAAVKKPMPLTLTFDVIVDDDTLAGTFKPGMFPAGPVSGVRL